MFISATYPRVGYFYEDFVSGERRSLALGGMNRSIGRAFEVINFESHAVWMWLFVVVLFLFLLMIELDDEVEVEKTQGWVH
jgi:hypothetical protein